MLKKGIIESVNENTAVVRIPGIDKSTFAVANISTKDLTPCPISTLPGIKPNLQVGDIVIVGFEDDNVSKPIILGTLLSKPTTSLCNITADSFVSVGSSKFNEETSIGSVSPTNLRSLVGYNTQLGTDMQNLLEIINNLNKKIEDLESRLSNLEM